MNPASVATRPAGNLRDEVATQLFVKLFDPSRGRTAEYIAALSIEAADTFVATIHR